MSSSPHILHDHAIPPLSTHTLCISPLRRRNFDQNINNHF